MALRAPVHGSDLKKANLDFWIIDRERDAFLMYLGTPGAKLLNMPSHWVFLWQGRRIYLQEFEKTSCNLFKPSGMVVSRKLVNFCIPDELAADKEQLIHMLKEAFEAYGFAGRTGNRGGPGGLDSFSRKLGAALRVKPPAELAAN